MSELCRSELLTSSAFLLLSPQQAKRLVFQAKPPRGTWCLGRHTDYSRICPNVWLGGRGLVSHGFTGHILRWGLWKRVEILTERTVLIYEKSRALLFSSDQNASQMYLSCKGYTSSRACCLLNCLLDCMWLYHDSERSAPGLQTPVTQNEHVCVVARPTVWNKMMFNNHFNNYFITYIWHSLKL